MMAVSCTLYLKVLLPDKNKSFSSSILTGEERRRKRVVIGSLSLVIRRLLALCIGALKVFSVVMLSAGVPLGNSPTPNAS